MTEDKGHYSVEVREPTRGGADYTEEHYEFNTPEEVGDYLKNEMHEDEGLHSVWFFPASGIRKNGSTTWYENGKNVTKEFYKYL